MKHPMVKISALSASIFAASTAMAGGFDNSSRGFDIIYGDSNVIDLTYGQTSVPMKARIQQGAGNTNNVVGSGEIIDDFTRPQVGVRYNIAENVTCATQIEQPFAAKVSYADDSLAYMNGSDAVSAPIDTEYNSESVTVACGYTFGLETGQVIVFGGPKLQSIDGSFSEDLAPNPAVTGENDNLFVELDGGSEVGYIVGAAYEIPEYALRASFLYHSQIDYDATGTVSANIPGSISFQTPGKAKTFTPQTVELAFQSGIAENTLAFLKMRWSEYGKLATLEVDGDGSTMTPISASASLSLDQINASESGALTPLIDPSVSMFSNDTFDYSLGLGHRLNDKITLGASFSGGIKLGGKSDDTPLGADSTSLRLPGDTSHTVSFGGEYAVMPSLKLSGGLGYTFIDSYRVETTSSSYRAEFDKTEATSFQFGLTYEI